MRYLLDVNALIAFGISRHQFHQRVTAWISSRQGSEFFTTPVTEIGFIRVVASVPIYHLNVLQARKLLLGMKTNARQPLTFLPDGNDTSLMPSWVTAPSQVTDGHLIRLAMDHEAVLATLDEQIPGSLLIPRQIEDHARAD
jgi:predicted nucleic acid-binding protein